MSAIPPRATAAVPGAGARATPRADRQAVAASALGTAFAWYDFYLYAALAPVLARQFFTGLGAGSAYVFALLAFAAGFLVRPLGALLFGRLGDMVGRKYTFLVTVLVMGQATVVMGILPGYASIGIAAPIVLLVLRLLQGLALGGEYGGAATYVAEHAPPGRRGAWTAWVQTTATLGLFLALAAILATRSLLGDAAFEDWGWRVPFLLSAVLLAVSVWMRLALDESPVFQQLRAEGRTSKAPLAESFGRWSNLRTVLLALFGLVAGQAVVWYAGQFYALSFLTTVLKVDEATASVLLCAALLVGTPFFLLAGALSDRVGRKPVILAGLLLAALTFFPVFQRLTLAANPALAQAQARQQVVVAAWPGECSFQGNPVARESDFRSSCDIAKRWLAQQAVSYRNEPAPAGAPATVRIGEVVLTAPAARVAHGRFDEDSSRAIAAFRSEATTALRSAGYPEAADPARIDKPAVVALLSLLVICVALVYGPLAAMLTELFPARIRYTSMSLPYHLGNGWFGGLMPTIAFAMVAHNGNVYFGLWYPVGMAAMSFVIALLFLRETRGADLVQ